MSIKKDMINISKSTIFLLGLGLLRLDVQAQEPLALVATDPVQVERVGEFDFGGLSASPNYRFYVFDTSQGWAVSSASFKGEVLLFDVAFQPIAGYGRPGEGPTEFTGIPIGGRLSTGWIAVDPASQKALIFNSQDSLMRSYRLPGPPFSVQTVGERLFLGGQFIRGGNVFTVIELELAGDGAVSYGAPSTALNPRADLPVLLPPFEGTIWAVKHTGGIIEILSVDDLSVADSIKIPLPGYSEIPGANNPARQPPPPQVLGASAMHDTAYLYVAVSDSDWNPGLRDLEAIFDTEVIVISLRKKAIIGVNRFPGFCQPMAADMGACLDSNTGNLNVFRFLPE